MNTSQSRDRAGALDGRVALITGASSGIGRATALLFAQERASICAVDLDADRGAELVERVRAQGGQAVFERADVTRAVDCQRAVNRAVATFGALHVLFNNAGIIRRATVVETSEEDWDRTMAVNVKSVFLMCREAIPHMARAGGGVIVSTASDWGLLGGTRAAAYCASKGAIVLLTKAMAADHGGQKIRVNCVCPGNTDTPMLRDEARQLGEETTRFLEASSDCPLGRIAHPDEIARAVLYLASDAASFVTGSALVVDGGAGAVCA